MDYVNIALDAMGGDNAPGEIVAGSVKAVCDKENIRIYLTGPKALIDEELSAYTFDQERVIAVDAPEVITNDEAPVAAIRTKKKSSIVVGLKLIKEGACDAFISAGSTGAILAGGATIAGRLKGIMRTPLAGLIPTSKGFSLLLDAGANVDARPAQMLQFAQMGSIYMEHVMKISSPRVGILNIGSEEEKGNALVKETFPLLKECSDINFVGSIEARDAVMGDVDIILCEAFAGNVLLKTYEGAGKVLFTEIKEALLSSLSGKIGALMIKNSLKSVLKKFTASEYGGAPLLGLKGLVVKAHGNATSKEIYNSIMQCITFKEQKISEKIQTMCNAE